MTAAHAMTGSSRLGPDGKADWQPDHRRVYCRTCGARVGQDCHDLANGLTNYAGHVARQIEAKRQYGREKG